MSPELERLCNAKLQFIKEWKDCKRNLFPEFILNCNHVRLQSFFSLIDNLRRTTRKSHSIYLCGSRFDESLCRSLSQAAMLFVSKTSAAPQQRNFSAFLIISRRCLSRLIRLKTSLPSREERERDLRFMLDFPETQRDDPTSHLNRHQSEFNGIVAFDSEDEIFMQMQSFKWSSTAHQTDHDSWAKQSSKSRSNCIGTGKRVKS